jgi:RNA polymerase subunit RPABC4/transcription elongation factor Spt4
MPNGDRLEPVLSSVPLLEAVLCADCEIISNSGGESCEVCGSRSLLSLGRVLGGSVGEERAVLVDADLARYRQGFTVLVNPDASNVLRRRRSGRG